MASRESDEEEDLDEDLDVQDYDVDAIIDEGDEEEPTSDDEEDVDCDGNLCESLCTLLRSASGTEGAVLHRA